jgi:hypothetical protein
MSISVRAILELSLQMGLDREICVSPVRILSFTLVTIHAPKRGSEANPPKSTTRIQGGGGVGRVGVQGLGHPVIQSEDRGSPVI